MTQQVGRYNKLKAGYYERQEAKKHIDMSGAQELRIWARDHSPALYQKLEKEDREAAARDAYERAHLDDPQTLAKYDELYDWFQQRKQRKYQAEYALLGIEPGAAKRDIKNAYRRQARKLHPDKGGDPEAFKAMYAAYRKLLTVAKD